MLDNRAGLGHGKTRGKVKGWQESRDPGMIATSSDHVWTSDSDCLPFHLEPAQAAFPGPVATALA